MKLNGITVRLVRNEYEYEKYVAASYVSANPWSSMAAKAPLLVFGFNLVSGQGDEDLTKTQLELTPAANWTNITPADGGEYTVDADNKKLNIDLTKLKGQLVVEAKKDCQFAKAPLRLEAVATNKNGVQWRDGYELVDVSDKKKILEIVDELADGAVNSLMAQIVYELCAQELPDAGIPEAPKDSKAYVRKNGAWVQETVGLADAPSDANAYGRKGAAWVKVTEAPAG